jgi:hypothetical protein
LRRGVNLLLGFIFGAGLIPLAALAKMSPPAVPSLPASRQATLAIDTVFDGEGEAAVLAYFQLPNTEKFWRESNGEFYVLLPGTQVRVLEVLQEVRRGGRKERRCIRWKPLSPSCPGSSNKRPCDRPEREYSPGGECVQWREYVVTPPTTELVDLTYTERETLEGKELRIRLVRGEEGSDGAANRAGARALRVYLAYKAEGYVTVLYPLYFFDFPTPQVKRDLAEVKVGVSVIPGLTLFGGKTYTTYRRPFAASLSEAPRAGTAAERYARKLRSEIGRSGQITRATRALDPLESFHVRGRYSRWGWVTSLWRVGLVAIIIIALVAVIIRGERKLAAALGTEQRKDKSPASAKNNAGR